MSEKKFRVTFEPDGRSVYVFPNTTVYEAVHEAGIIIKSDCGGMGICGKCKVSIMEGDFEQKGSERFISEEDIKKGHVLACRTNILSDMVVEIPISSRLYEQKILTEGVKRELKLAPNVKKVYIKVDKPTLEDQRADLDRIWGSLKKLADKPKITVDVLRRLPDKLRKGNFGITIVLNESEIIGIERDDKTEKNYGLAFDIGTTTVVGYLLNLNTGEQLAVAAKTNPQTGFGDDVISRIQFANTNNDGLETLS